MSIDFILIFCIIIIIVFYFSNNSFEFFSGGTTIQMNSNDASPNETTLSYYNPLILPIYYQDGTNTITENDLFNINQCSSPEQYLQHKFNSDGKININAYLPTQDYIVYDNGQS